MHGRFDNFHNFHGHEGTPVLHWLVPLLFLAVLVGFGIWMVLRLGQRPVAPAGPAAASLDPALAELRLRYARGEVDRDQYLRLAADLGPAPPEPGPATMSG